MINLLITHSSKFGRTNQNFALLQFLLQSRTFNRKSFVQIFASTQLSWFHKLKLDMFLFKIFDALLEKFLQYYSNCHLLNPLQIRFFFFCYGIIPNLEILFQKGPNVQNIDVYKINMSVFSCHFKSDWIMMPRSLVCWIVSSRLFSKYSLVANW